MWRHLSSTQGHLIWGCATFAGIYFQKASHWLRCQSCVLAPLKRKKGLRQQPKSAALDEITRRDTHIPSLMTSNLTMRNIIAALGRHKSIEGPTVPSPSEPPWFFPPQIQQGVGDISQTFVGSLKVSLQTCLPHSLDASRLFLCIPMDWEEPAPDSRCVSSRGANHRDNDIKGRSVTQGCWESQIQRECGFSRTQQWN